MRRVKLTADRMQSTLQNFSLLEILCVDLTVYGSEAAFGYFDECFKIAHYSEFMSLQRSLTNSYFEKTTKTLSFKMTSTLSNGD